MEPADTPLGPIGLILPTFPQNTDSPWPQAPAPGGPASDLATVCRQAEQLGASALWACDHVFWHGSCLECLVALTVADTATERAMLGTCVVQLPLRQACVVAKQAATLQILSAGRMILGVGVGSHPGEYAEAGVDYHRRGRLLDAGIAELRRSWASGEGVVTGATDQAGSARYRQLPGPAAIPVWCGGSSEAALRRAATLADGWMPLFLTPGEYADAVDRLAKETAAAGRPEDAVTPSLAVFVSVDDDPVVARRRGTAWMSSLYGIPAKAFERHLVSGSTAEVTAAITAYLAAGCRHVALYVTADQPMDQFEHLTSALRRAGVPT
jgi:alkanesulfonate monooxygenase SsuD/methylene tetrahydromethanopterin reductase-like flavin-dependent oxidoreductase (luciferase family)